MIMVTRKEEKEDVVAATSTMPVATPAAERSKAPTRGFRLTREGMASEKKSHRRQALVTVPAVDSSEKFVSVKKKKKFSAGSSGEKKRSCLEEGEEEDEEKKAPFSFSTAREEEGEEA
ncbi:unnamed protein product [Linum tenue]|uniref:Uncharacterized protein n=1 Tax=Linum tenue TaxID=586396 RepID=A0AAV0S0I5_9ROSI|nr:unnamed protein product [Linum tenue]